MRWVVKIGGSLASYRELGQWLRILTGKGAGRTVIVPGGGPFADAVRKAQVDLQFDDVTAHRMALLAMEQYAYLLLRLAPELMAAASEGEILRILTNGRVPVWLPSALPLAIPGLPASWETTSDSLAVWLAGRLEADALVLVKSATLPASPGLDEMSSSGLLDGAFGPLARIYPGTIVWMDRTEPGRLRAAMDGESLSKCGTVIKESGTGHPVWPVPE